MIHDLRTMIWKEWREYLSGRRALLQIGLIVFFFSLFGPLQSGTAWLDSPVTLVLNGVYLPLVIVMTVIADAFAGERERHTLETLLASRLSDRAILLGKIAAAVGYASMIALVVAAIGLLLVNLLDLNAAPLLPAPLTVLALLALPPLVATLMAGVGALVSLRAPTMKQAQQILSLGVTTIVFVPLVGIGFLPATVRRDLFRWLTTISAAELSMVGGALLVLVDLLVILVLLARFRRSRLMLD